MRKTIAIALLAGAALSAAGCETIQLRNDNLAHTLYDCPLHQGLIQLNDATDAHAWADTDFSRRWVAANDADCYTPFHECLNQPGWEW